jgi:hypothetical protein
MRRDGTVRREKALSIPGPEFEDQRHITASVPRIIKGFFA